MLIQKSQLEIIQAKASTEQNVWAELLVELITFIKEDLLVDGKLIVINTKNPLHWLTIFKIGKRLIKLLIKMVKSI